MKLSIKVELQKTIPYFSLDIISVVRQQCQVFVTSKIIKSGKLKVAHKERNNVGVHVQCPVLKVLFI